MQSCKINEYGKYRDLAEDEEIAREEAGFDATERKKQKEAKIRRELNKLKRIFKSLPPDTKDTVASLIANAAFMAVTLEELQEEINLNGTTERYQNGDNQFGVKKSSAVEVYNTMIKNHMGCIKQLTDLLPKATTAGPGDDFDDFAKEK